MTMKTCCHCCGWYSDLTDGGPGALRCCPHCGKRVVSGRNEGNNTDF